MAKALIIAEKPSVAADIARALGGFERQGDYFESDDAVISSAVGHLVEIAAPEQFEVKRGKWSFANLPVIPPHFDLKPIDKTGDRLKLLTRLIRRKDVDRIVNACDAGREGELIFRLIVQHANARQPVQRLWLQSMTPAAIRDGFAHLRPGSELEPLAAAARSRSEADWLVGINGTRAMTAFNSRDGGFYLTTVGRVQTPTLTVVVEREEKIRRFVPRDYFEVKATFGAQAGTYEGKWFDPTFKRDRNVPEDPELRADRLWVREDADAIVAACQGQPGVATEESKPSSQAAPALFDLTTLQREANGRFGFSAKTTLSLAQALYERHKVLTYPRTDSRALPEDYVATVVETMQVLSGSQAVGTFAKRVLDNGWVKPNKRIFDNTKISDHFAIIPTLQAPKSLSDAEAKLYDLVVRRFLAVFFPAAQYQVTTRVTRITAAQTTHAFRTEGRVLVDPGWLAVYGREAQSDAATPNLTPIQAPETVRTEQIDAIALQTRPPPRFSEATLLSAMEGAGKTIDDEALREAMAGKGLGTPATRAAIIEGLITERYLLREGRELIPTAKAFQLVTLLRGLGVAELTMPELTGEWENKLARMERGELGRDAFMDQIAAMTKQIVERARNYEADTVPGDYATLDAPCPSCGAQVRENYKRFACTNCEWSISKIPGGRAFEIPEVEELIAQRTIGPLTGFRSKMGRPFSAILKLTDDNRLEFDFGQDGADDEQSEAIDFSDQTPLGPCPKCSTGQVFIHGMNYVCDQASGPARTCDFRSGREILQQPIEPQQMTKLLHDGRTDLLTNFVSSRTRRKFKAFLVRQPDGKIGFEFQPRPEKPVTAAAAARRARAGAAQDAATDGDAAAGAAAGDAAVGASAGRSAAGASAGRSAAGAAATRPSTRSAAKKPAATKAATKSTAAKPAAGSSAAKKSVATKPAPKKPAAKKPATPRAATAKPAAARATSRAKAPASTD